MQRIIRFGLLRNTALSSSGHHCFSAPFSTTNSKCQDANPSPQVDTKTRESATNSSSLTSQNPNEKVTFAKLFKESKFVALGDLSNKYLIGRIVEVIGDDLYIDYGGKFNCICKRPLNNASNYKRNANVKIRLVSFEMASYFLNAARHITLLESDADLVGLVRSEDGDAGKDTEKDKRNQLMRKEIAQLNSDPYF